MNELYNQIGQAAYIHANQIQTNQDPTWVSIVHKKFAETAIEEMYTFVTSEIDSGNGMPSLDKVKEHFGIVA